MEPAEAQDIAPAVAPSSGPATVPAIFPDTGLAIEPAIEHAVGTHAIEHAVGAPADELVIAAHASGLVVGTHAAGPAVAPAHEIIGQYIEPVDARSDLDKDDDDDDDDRWPPSLRAATACSSARSTPSVDLIERDLNEWAEPPRAEVREKSRRLLRRRAPSHARRLRMRSKPVPRAYLPRAHHLPPWTLAALGQPSLSSARRPRASGSSR